MGPMSPNMDCVRITAEALKLTKPWVPTSVQKSQHHTKCWLVGSHFQDLSDDCKVQSGLTSTGVNQRQGHKQPLEKERVSVALWAKAKE